jgi:hypothetical protein
MVKFRYVRGARPRRHGARQSADLRPDGVVSGRGHARSRTAAALDLALDFQTWHSLARRSGLSRDEAVEVMVRAIRCAT